MDLIQELIGLRGLGISGFTLGDALLGLLLSFILGQLTAWVYIYTHSGLSYSRSFVQSLILLSIIVALGMMVIGNNIVVAFGLIGALAVIRFRNILKDTRDTAFVFFVLIMGMGCGTGRYQLVVLGTLLFSAVLLYLKWVAFGSRHNSDGFVRFHLSGEKKALEDIQSTFNRYCWSIRLISQRFYEGTGEFAYSLTMRDPSRGNELVADLQLIKGISHVTFVLQEEQAEI